MSLIKAYYISRASGEAGYSYDGNDFTPIAAVPPEMDGGNGCVGVDPNNGNKVFFATTGSGVSGPIIRVSDDNGNTLQIPGGDWYTFDIVINSGVGARIIVLDSNISYIYGTAGLYKSIDGGLNYNIVNTDFASLYSSSIGFVKMHMSDEQNGLLGISNPGITPAPYVKLFRTSDGGVSWTLITGFDSLISQDQICGVHLSADGTKMIVVGKEKIYRSTDSGSTWSVVLGFSSINTAIYGAAFDPINDQVMYALGGNNSVYKTSDSGASWTLQSSDSSLNDSYLFSFYSEQEGFTSRNIAGQDALLRTFDSGVTWTQVDTTSSPPLDLQSVFYNCGECPDNFTKVSNDQCDGTSLGPLLCPSGFEYNALSQNCECKGQCDCPPTEVILVVDNGTSVSINEIDQLKTFLNTLLDHPSIQDLAINQQKLKIGLTVFNINAYQIYPTSTNIGEPGNTTAPIRQSINGLTNTTGTGTNTAAGLAVAANKLAQSRMSPGYNPETIQKIILITDGFPNGAEDATSGSWTDTITINSETPRTYSVTHDVASPCDQRTLGNYSDCDRCNIYERTLQIADDLKSIDGVYITVAILAEVLSTNLNSVLTTTATNPGSAPSIEAYMTYRALIQGFLDQQTHIFPPSQDINSPYYVASGYEPPSPQVGGWLSLSGLTGVTEGVPFGRILYNTLSSTTNYTPYTTGSPFTQWSALPSSYSGLTGTNPFNPFGLWNCNTPGDPANPLAPLCSYKIDGVTPDVYVTEFVQAAALLAPALATDICNVSIDINCNEGCTPVQYGTNVRCECEKTLFITPCVYKIYDCTDPATPLYCTQEDLSAYLDPNISVRITVDGPEISGCYKVALSDVDYCEPLDYSIITVTSFYNSCEECQPKFVRLTSCTNETVYIQVASDYLYNNIGKSVELFEYPALCWRVDFEPTFPSITIPVTVKQIYDDCLCCQQYSCKN